MALLGKRSHRAYVASLNGHLPETSPRDWLWVHALGAAVRRFQYFRDELFLAAATCYGLNRWLIKPVVASPFMRGQFNDLLLIPAALPLVLWVQRQTGLRTEDAAPSWSEIGLHLGVWSLICEWIGPHWLHHGTADPWDVAAYGTGGLLAGIWWNRRAGNRAGSKPRL